MRVFCPHSGVTRAKFGMFVDMCVEFTLLGFPSKTGKVGLAFWQGVAAGLSEGFLCFVLDGLAVLFHCGALTPSIMHSTAHAHPEM